MKVREFMQRYEAKRLNEDELYKWDHSLQSLAKHRAAHSQAMHVGTAFDWDDLERYQKELNRMEQEGS